MRVNGQEWTSIWPLDGGASVGIIDQSVLPHEFRTATISSWRDMAHAISSMKVRGAPLIGVSGAWAVALAAREDPSDAALWAACGEIARARPTAVNLMWAVARMRRLLEGTEPQQRAAAALAEALAMTCEDIETNRAIGMHACGIIRAIHERSGRPVRILTHCNAGWLATVDWGTALSGIFAAHREGIPVEVLVDETRPRNQGLLTEWELRMHGIPHRLAADNAGGLLMLRGEIDMAVVGADRITIRGDVANKVGTYLKALAARDCGVPFYVAAPMSTVDPDLADGADIPIEERSGDELRVVSGLSPEGVPASVRIAPAEVPVANPAFDVTPARLVTGIITEQGVIAPADLASHFGRL